MSCDDTTFVCDHESPTPPPPPRFGLFHGTGRCYSAGMWESAVVILFFVPAVLIAAVNPGYLAPLAEQSAGRLMVLAALVMMALGSFVLKKIVSIKG